MLNFRLALGLTNLRKIQRLVSELCFFVNAVSGYGNAHVCVGGGGGRAPLKTTLWHFSGIVKPKRYKITAEKKKPTPDHRVHIRVEEK
jgi:hypothetical protein